MGNVRTPWDTFLDTPGRYCISLTNWQQCPPGDTKGVGQEESYPAVIESETQFWKTPPADYDFSFGNVHGKFWCLGTTSSWSFCRRVLPVIGKRLPEGESSPVPWNLDGAAFPMQWEPLAWNEQPDVSNLPPMDYALFLYNTTKFYLGAMVYLIDETSFMRNLRELYEDPASKALLGLAGHQYALRAMRILPKWSALPEDTLDAIQALSLAAVYLQSIDMRVAAFQLVGQALRTLILEGMHRHMPEQVAGTEYSRRRNLMFWAVYTLDREFSSLIGTPSSIRDEDITVKSGAFIKRNCRVCNYGIVFVRDRG